MQLLTFETQITPLPILLACQPSKGGLLDGNCEDFALMKQHRYVGCTMEQICDVEILQGEVTLTPYKRLLESCKCLFFASLKTRHNGDSDGERREGHKGAHRTRSAISARPQRASRAPASLPTRRAMWPSAERASRAARLAQHKRPPSAAAMAARQLMR